ncbi:MAG: FeoB-associated Cys-rich membrane protein [Verrucomicrobiota bacterium]
MNPLLDQLLVAFLILCAITFFVVRMLRKRGKPGCDAGCGCSATKLGTADKRR